MVIKMNEEMTASYDIRLPDDPTPADTAKFIVQVLDRKKARDIKLLSVEKQTVIADYFVICTGTSTTQVKSLADEVEFRLEQQGVSASHVEGKRGDGWILLDYAGVIVHIFSRDARDFYKLEKLYDGTTEEDISDIISED
jgi:ribosome-associated protein